MPVKSRAPLLAAIKCNRCAHCLSMFLNSQSSHVPASSLRFPDTCTRALFLDLEQTSLLFSALAPLFSEMFARCLVHGSVAPTFRRGACALSGSRDRGLAVLYRRSVRTRREDEREKERKRKRRERGCRRARDRRRERNSRTSFLDVSRHPTGKNPDACLTTTGEKKT